MKKIQLLLKDIKQKKKETETKPKKEKTTNTSSISIPSPQMPTHALLSLERIKSSVSEFPLDHVITLQNIPTLMNQIHTPVLKMKPEERLQYLKTMKLKKTSHEIKEKTKKNENS